MVMTFPLLGVGSAAPDEDPFAAALYSESAPIPRSGSFISCCDIFGKPVRPGGPSGSPGRPTERPGGFHEVMLIVLRFNVGWPRWLTHRASVRNGPASRALNR